MSAPSAALAAKASLVAICQSLWLEPVHVTYGPLGTNEPDDTVEVLGIAMVEGKPRLGAQRRRWHSFIISARISTFRGGGEEAQQLADEAALTMLGQLADYLQDSGTVPSTQTSLGGVVQWGRITDFELSNEEDDIDAGRQAYLDFTVSGEVVA